MPVAELMAQYGKTPVVVQTPSGGHHLYYRQNGERNGSGLQGRKIDKRYVRYDGILHQTLWKVYPDAACLLHYLQAHHTNRSEPFAISAKALQAHLGIDCWRIRKAINILVKEKVIRQVHIGGRKPGDPHRYLWGQNLYPI